VVAAEQAAGASEGVLEQRMGQLVFPARGVVEVAGRVELVGAIRRDPQLTGLSVRYARAARGATSAPRPPLALP
jgi:hypothetical protein